MGGPTLWLLRNLVHIRRSVQHWHMHVIPHRERSPKYRKGERNIKALPHLPVTNFRSSPLISSDKFTLSYWTYCNSEIQDRDLSDDLWLGTSRIVNHIFYICLSSDYFDEIILALCKGFNVSKRMNVNQPTKLLWCIQFCTF